VLSVLLLLAIVLFVLLLAIVLFVLLLAIVLFILHRCTDSDYPFDIFKLFLLFIFSKSITFLTKHVLLIDDSSTVLSSLPSMSYTIHSTSLFRTLRKKILISCNQLTPVYHNRKWKHKHFIFLYFALPVKTLTLQRDPSIV
jgi:hypothetical protein